MKAKTAKGKDALLEIGTEEIPARFIGPALAFLSQQARAVLTEKGLVPEEIQTFGTPRRLTLFLKGLPPKSKDRVEEVVGPPPKAAKTPEGEWTKAGTGFAKSVGVSPNKLVLKETAKGPRYVFEKPIRGQKAEALLKETFPTLIAQIPFPKTMRWNETGFRFARPIRWIVALFNGGVVRFSVAGLRSDRSTYGLNALGAKKIAVTNPSRYESLLQNRCIVVSPDERKKKIESLLETLSKKAKGKAIVEADHLEEVVFLTEYPTGILGSFPKEYLDLPREVLVSSLRNHQKFFPIETSKKNLANSFIGVRNGPTDAHESVRDGYERVLNARLSDAKFFFDADRKIPLADFEARLSEIVVHEKLGTLEDKKKRVSSLVKTMGAALGFSSSDLTLAERAARLSKADLLTQMVGEFPELQGVAGRFYAEAQGEESAISKAIEEHYQPLTAEGDLPQTAIGALVSIADKLDNLAMNFFVGNIPSGSADPYGLRRMTIGLIRIFLDQKWPLSISDALDMALGFDLYKEKKETVKADLARFLFQRFSGLYGSRGYRPDEIEAVFGSGDHSFAEIEGKLRSLKTIRGKPEFLSLAAAIKRTQNILRQAREKGVQSNNVSLDENVMTESSEKNLLKTLTQSRPVVNDAISAKDYSKALVELSKFKNPVDQFFDGVMVMAEDPNLRSQRLALLSEIQNLFGAVADFSKLQAPGQKN